MGLDTEITRTASEIAEICGADLVGDGSIELVGTASLRDAGAREISFLGNPLYRRELETTRAGAVVLGRNVEVARRDLALLYCDDPNAAFSRVILAFRGAAEAPPAGVHASAVVADGARLGRDVGVGACAVVGAGATLGDRVVVHAGAVVGAGAEIGADSVVHANAVIYPGVKVGARCIVHAGAVIGSEGFGFDPRPDGWAKVPQCGTVVLEDDVEVGANTTIDRARFGATRVGRGTKIDNLVQIGHNCEIGPGVLVIAQAGLAGSARVGARAILAGQVGVAGHVEIGAGARVGAKGGVIGNLPAGGEYWGFPAVPRIEGLRAAAAARRVPELLKTVRELEARVRTLEEAAR